MGSIQHRTESGGTPSKYWVLERETSLKDIFQAQFDFHTDCRMLDTISFIWIWTD